ncbi:hypothetical protein [Bifidobacterium subtile]|jgi:hypothetical protein|uniref:Uncharacterized protein n=1 Tax=Bifidobacterium subtile TaxID=77635 RepID=A0A087DU00_9BIFI|nr:hypothetical protein [Bifidobacterium subtile]KFI99000.1 hypothetical protein BISU_2201 [Bifidobacterium subtile]MCI1222539.1 hypothetical protein [Bifidobacterium subtile]MCI1240881.1 hypothetical protein [Bifidobacterium subtile]MCI1258152.1 hypothetical protein [Bifidobacterium subtile]QOL36974.1 hypothetical protein BS3272_03235 [Bifidobacterium subtile]
MADGNENDDDFDSRDERPDDLHFSDEELAAALEGFEQEFEEGGETQPSPSEQGNDGIASTTSGAADAFDATAEDNAANAAERPNASASASPSAPQSPLDAADSALDFDEELRGLVGDKAKGAALITRLASARLLAAFCQISDISADCIGSDQGAVAVLRNLDGDAPESAAKDLTTVVSGMAAVLAVNRADKLDSTLYLHGEAGQTFAPPILFASAPDFVEDLMLGIASLADLREQGLHIIDSASLDHDAAMAIIAEHTRFGRGASHIR